MSKIAVLIPHKHTPANDRALEIAMQCIIANTRTDYELLIDTQTPACPYTVINQMARHTDAEFLVFSNSDVFFAPGWDVPMLETAAPDVIVTGVLVEPGAIAVSDQNLALQFGATPQAFRRDEFEQWVAETPIVPNGEGWYFPSMHHRETFLARGGFDLSRGVFPEPLDSHYWNAWHQSGNRVLRVPSFAYHLQNWSNEAEQGKAVRYG